MGYSSDSNSGGVLLNDVKGLVNGRPLGTISVTEFGAIGNGIADDTSEIQATIDLAASQGGGIVYLPPGRYRTSNSLRLKDNVTLQGAGFSTIIACQNGSDVVINDDVINGNTKLVIRDFKIDGTSSHLPNNGVALRGCTNCLIYGVEVDSVAGYSIVLWMANNFTVPCQRVVIANCITHDSIDNGIELYGAKDCAVIGNISYNNTNHGIQVWNGARNVTVANNVCFGNNGGITLFAYDANSALIDTRDITITGNICRDNNLTGIMIQGSTDLPVINVRVANNVITKSTTVTTGGTQQGGIFLFNVKEISLAGNTIRGNYYGIYAQRSTTGTVKPLDDIEITDNSISGTGAHGIYVVNAKALKVTSNRSKNNPFSGIDLTDIINGGVIQGNICYNNGSTSGDGLRIESTATTENLIVTDNFCFDDQATKTQSRGINFIGTFDYCVIANNNARGNIVSIGVAMPAIANNRISGNQPFKTENNGTATVASGATSIVVNHGLNMTPTLNNISVTPTNNLGSSTKYWISNPTATQFTINVDVAPGAATAAFAWTARIS